jgi:hypothetical protein
MTQLVALSGARGVFNETKNRPGTRNKWTLKMGDKWDLITFFSSLEKAISYEEQLAAAGVPFCLMLRGCASKFLARAPSRPGKFHVLFPCLLFVYKLCLTGLIDVQIDT